MPELFDDVGRCVDAAIRVVGRRIVLGLPLGIGKPIPVANEFFRRALREPSLELTIVTALSLRRPTPSGELEARFAGPLVQRIFGDYEDLEYVRALRANRVPPNVRVIEFYLEPGASLGVTHSQQNYLSANYTHVARELDRRGVNVIAHLVAKRGTAKDFKLSLSSNPDVTLDLMPLLDRARMEGRRTFFIGQVHRELPFMLGSAEVPPDRFDAILEHEHMQQQLFCPPNPALSLIDHAIGLHASALVADGGTLQIGIGELGDTVCYALLLRHQQNEAYRQALKDAGTERSAAALIDAEGGRDPFAKGLFACSEMLVDQMLDLYRGGVLHRRVYDSLPLSRLIASGNIGDDFDARILQDLLHVGVPARLDERMFRHLQHFGVFRQDCRWERGRIRSPEGAWIEPNLEDRAAVFALANQCLGRELRNGHVAQAGFFLGPKGFYAALRDLPDDDRRQFDMRGVGWVNQLYGEEAELKRLQRVKARFINTAMMGTLLGAAVSDALDDGRVVSGVGGQYNFVAMAHALPDARSVLCIRATRRKDGRTTSNILWSYGHSTIPRHLRDIVVTEYGVADLRGRTDAECIAALLNVTDSRFQRGLLEQAKRAGKIESSYAIPEPFRQNLPERLRRSLSSHVKAGLFSEYPFGTELTREEVALARALRLLKDVTATPWGRLLTVGAAVFRRPSGDDLACLARMGLQNPGGRNEKLLARLVVWALRQSRLLGV